MDPLGNIPLFLPILSKVSPERQQRVLLRELAIAFVVLVLFLFSGTHFLALLGVSEPSLTVAGGTILFMIAIRMIFPKTRREGEMELDGEPFLVPLAVPLIAGPSAMATVILIMSREPERWPEWLGALAVAWAATGVILFAASGLRRFLGVPHAGRRCALR
jgi:small neutral amino acid transporter SnatA (MarC family)